ncbi:unnamed protein product [Candidula unifasciata]|uniref:Uncharacterized protein n=1 Tax=Candidula unifasciata TaxID=100452 RepID=A0A8S3YN99_9EUPU|nr:unnamed protein product [Candidula unifasciata]
MKGILMYMMGPCGPGATLPKSESDEFSDRTSDLDFDELASERSRVDGGSSTDESNKEAAVTSAGSHKEVKRQKHRPKSLSLSHSHSHTSSDEEEGSGGSDKKEDTWTGDKRERHGKSKHHSSASHLPTDPSLVSFSALSAGLQKAKKLLTNTDDGVKVKGRDLVSLQDLIDNHAVNSPTPPRSPSWREGLESPPFSPRRRDSYPGKRRGSLSPKEKNNHFTYTDISPPSRQLSLDELYGEASTHPSALDNGVAGSHAAQKPSPISPDEMKGSFISTSGQTLMFDMPAVRAKPPVSIPGPQTQHADLYMSSTIAHSTPVMDLATYAATIANSTASLTSMSVSPTNLLPQSSHPPVAEPMSPDSADSVDSSCSSPVSPGYYDNAPAPSEEVEEVELADPSSKSIDFQGSKRQKARPPSTDWSPVIDLSPILDVSPSVEEAEQEDMLAKQMEELERQRSREEAAEDEYEDEESESFEARPFFESKSFGPAKKSIPQVIPRIPAPPSAKKLKQQLNEELDDFDIDEVETPEDVSPYMYGSSLKRCGNFEDISRLGSDNSLIKHTSDLLSSDRLVDDIDLNDTSSDLPFFSCTTQSQTLSHSMPGASTTVSSLQAPGRQLPEKAAEEQGTKRIRDMESLITDEFHKVAEDMENIVKRGAMDVKPIPPPKPKRRLPDPDLLISPPPASKGSFEGSERRPCPSIRTEEVVDTSSSIDSSFDEAPSGKYLPRQDSTEKKKAKDMKAKPSPILVQYIEAEEQSVSPHYRVMESPPTPETKTIKREFSDSTSVSPNSSPDQDVYAFPSPVTPPDSDSSPPKPHSPSSPAADFDEESSTIAYDTLDPYRASSPYDNAKPCHKPRRTSPSIGTLQSAASSSQADQQLATSKPEVMRPPISPRKSIRKFDDKNTNARSSPVYENVQDLTTQEYLQEQQKHALFLTDVSDTAASRKGFTRLDAMSKGLGGQYSTQPAEIITFPLAGDFTGRKRSSSAPATELQEIPKPSQRPEPALRPRSASAEYEQEPPLERTPSVRDKIRAFEEVNICDVHCINLLACVPLSCIM